MKVEVIDTSKNPTFDADGGRWVTYCRKHGNVCNHPTKAIAEKFKNNPEDWCEDCRKQAGYFTETKEF